MELTIAALVGSDKNERLEVRLPGLRRGCFRGPSLAELLDDAALDLMEAVQTWKPAQLQRLILNPQVCLRTITLEKDLAFGDVRKKQPVKIRLTVFCEKWPDEPFWHLRLPRLDDTPFAVSSLRGLTSALELYVQTWAKTGSRTTLENAKPLRDEHLQLLDVELELPSILPSRPKKRKTRKKKGQPTEKPDKVWVPAYELRQVGVSLTHRALDGRLRPALGRDGLVDDLTTQLARDGSCVLLVGERGVGKTAILEAVATRFANKGQTLKSRTDFWRVDGGRLIAGMCYVGQWEARLQRVVEEIYHRDDVLVVDDLPSLVWSGRSAQADTTMADYLLPHLERGELRILAECTPQRLEAARLVNPGFFAHFRVHQVQPLTTDQTYDVLLHHTRETERARNLVCDPGLIESLLQLAARFGPRMVEPGRSVAMARRFLDEANGGTPDRFARKRVLPSDLRTHLGQETGLPDFVLTPGAARTAEDTATWFREHIVGQPNAIGCVTDVVCTLQQGLEDPDRPIATLLFVGPTGVGKTETAKALATYLFGHASKLLRFDMSEVQGPQALARLVGGEGRTDGDLTRAVTNTPFSVVLLDEIEKAGPQVFDLLLQVLGEGRLTNAAGETTDFRNTVVIMTSNLGAGSGRRQTGFDRHSVASEATHYRAAAEGFFRPEFFNRIDRVVPFRSLSREDVEPLVQRIVGRVAARRGLRAAGVVVRLDDNIRDHLAEHGFDAQYGARSLQRVVEQELAVPLARVLVDQNPTGDGLFLDVWRGQKTEVCIRSLASSPTEQHLGLLGSWNAIAAQHLALQDAITELSADPRYHAVESERSTWLSRASEGLTESDWDALGAATAIVEARSSLVSDLEDYATDHLASHRYLDAHERVRVSRRARSGYGDHKKQTLTKPAVVPVDRSRTLGKASRALLALELRAAEILHRLDHGAPTTLVVRVQPLHDEAGALAHTLTQQLLGAWSTWGRFETFTRDATWIRTTHPGAFGADGDSDHHAHWSAQTSTGAAAVALTAPGLRLLLKPLLGLAVRAFTVGADRRLHLCRVDADVGDPLQVLRTMDLADEERAARVRAGEEVPFPPVRLRLGTLRDEDSMAPSLDTLSDDLVRLGLLPRVR